MTPAATSSSSLHAWLDSKNKGENKKASKKKAKRIPSDADSEDAENPVFLSILQGRRRSVADDADYGGGLRKRPSHYALEASEPSNRALTNESDQPLFLSVLQQKSRSKRLRAGTYIVRV
jgi:hypothetical protein